jgi:hypothetical protein
LESDPEKLVDKTMRVRGTSTNTFVTMARSLLETAHDDGTIRRDHPVLAETLVLLALSMILHGPVLFGSTERIDEELAWLLDRTMTP